MSDPEEKIIKIYDGSRPVEEDLFERNWINQLAWSLVVVLCSIVVWFAIAIVNAENQRHALITKQCADPVFKGEVDMRCLQVVSSRPHWWEHLWYGITHLRPAQK
ncbi:hypothetical protein RBA41_18540 [Massilia sp. CCM 9210]|uniref:hypothetical protein n=1 Tax=Massilia scottii TaxID=3057166 RepID=UPI002796CF58|nr:hypothetical protein [Massilia sp. CCM 9210]MDQ1815302.1 hypothetical protein [Massilia sp. CCM 9210]